MDFEQLSIRTSDEVTEIVIRIGAVGHDHAQAQVEVRDARGQLVSMMSKHHFDLAAVESHVASLVASSVEMLHRRHSPF